MYQYSDTLILHLHFIHDCNMPSIFVPTRLQTSTPYRMPTSLDISSLNIVQAGELKVVFWDGTDKDKQTIFSEWYASKKYWENSNTDPARAAKMKNLPWESPKSSRIWDLFQQGATLADGRPIVYCNLCHKTYPHTAITGTTTAQSHLKRKEHIMKAKELLFGNVLSESEVDHEELVAKLRRAGTTGVLVRISFDNPLDHLANQRCVDLDC